MIHFSAPRTNGNSGLTDDKIENRFNVARGENIPVRNFGGGMKISLAGCSRVILTNACIVLVSFGVGVMLNHSFVAGPQEQSFSYTETDGKPEFKPLTAAEASASTSFSEIRLEELKKALEKGEVILLDGRSEKDYENGHIPSAYSLSVTDFEKRFPQVASRFSKEDRLVVYCGAGGCGLSRRLATLLHQRGYSRVRIYYGGYNDWFLASNPVVKGKETP
jgi:rhodanese-related sulfurtransferase